MPPYRMEIPDFFYSNAVRLCIAVQQGSPVAFTASLNYYLG